jgi:hypothetical protein
MSGNQSTGRARREPLVKVGDRYERLVVTSVSHMKTSSGWRWFASSICDCGNANTSRDDSLVSGKVRSCGCLQRESAGAINRSHMLSNSPTYSTWANMLTRCTNPKFEDWDRYGGRGIRVCQAWFSFEAFLADMGERPSPSHSLDRYPDQNGNYEPGNCRWATGKEQCRNRRDNNLITFNGETKTAAEWSEITGITPSTLRARTRAGWPADKCLTTPVQSAGSRSSGKGTPLSVSEMISQQHPTQAPATN